MNYIQLFKKDLEANYSKIAIVDKYCQRSTTYEQLDKLSDKIADKLHSLGYLKNSYIIVKLDRKMEYIAAYLGILKAGMAVVPAAMNYPDDRIAFMKKDCNAKHVIEDDFFYDLDGYDSYLDLASDTDPGLLIYTSGSTGKPKGVLQGNAGVANAVIQKQALFEGIDEIRFPSCVMMTFAVHILEYLTVFSLKGTTYIVDDETRKDVRKIEQFYKDNNITIGQISPQILKLFKVDDLSYLKRIITGAERIVNIYFENVEILNMYGCTEAGGSFTRFKIDKPYDNTPVGKPIKGIEVKILDDNGNEVARGQEGEICALGDFYVSYFNDPELSKQRFVKQTDGRTLLHTGDLGYVNENDNIIFVNRKDWMLKINGHRVEPGEIERTMLDLFDVKNAFVKGFVNNNGQTYMCGYYISDSQIDKNTFVNGLKEKLPEYMIPSFFIRLDKVPLNQNGKIDRLSLKPVDPSEFHANYVAPNNDTEAALCYAFEETLNCGIVGIDDDFYALGGNSINTILMIEKSSLENLTPAIVLEEKTVRKIALRLNSTIDIYKDTYITKDAYNLTDSQMGVYLDCVNKPDSLAYNIPVTFYCEKDGRIDPTKLKDSLKAAIDNHPVLRHVVKEIDGSPKLVDSGKDVEVKLVSLKEDDVKTYITNFVRPFNFNGDLLTRAEIIETEKSIYIQVDIHHIIFDGTSSNILFNDMVLAYNDKPLTKEKLSIFNESIYEETVNSKGKIDYFTNRFSGIDSDSNIYTDIVKNRSEINSVNTYKYTINCDKIDEYITSNNINKSSFFLSAFAYSLAKFNNINDVVFCTVNNGRKDHRFENSVGMFVRTMPILSNINEENNIADYIKNTQKDYLDTLRNDNFNYIEIAKACDIKSDIMFVYQGDMYINLAINDVKFNSYHDVYDGQANIAFQVFNDNNKYIIELQYLENLYSKSIIKSFIKLYECVVNGFVSEEQLKDISLLSYVDEKILDSFNDTEVEYENTKTIVEQFNNQVKLTPNNECVVFENNHYTYSQVDDITNRLAKYLRKCGVDRNKIVGVLINRSEYMPICSLAILKAGGAYMPLDPDYPKERLNLMMNDSNAYMLICNEQLSSIIDDSYQGQRLFTENIMNIEDSDVALPLPKLEDYFIILYTSGSTGKPKGVIYNHSNVLVTTAWVKDKLEITGSSRIAAYASYGFDANVFDTYASLVSGACLHIISSEIRLDLIKLRDYYNDNGITNAMLTTQIGRQFALLEDVKTLKHLVVGGEKLTPLNPPQNFALHNAYGPTEGSVISTDFIVDDFYNDVPIGKPVDNLKTFIVDKQGRRLPLGAIGELWITGPHVTQGYLNLPDKTNEVYTTNYFESGEYSRTYHTGDIVRYLPDGNIQFIGRRDAQVKIRGFRIELTEIEEVIRRFTDIKDATVAAFDDAAGGKFIVTYIVSDKQINIDDLKAFIGNEKPAYMIPTVIMQIDKIPLNQNSKVNRKALPVPEFKNDDDSKPTTDLQKQIFSIISQLIGHESFGIDTDIFDAGLSSIATVELNIKLSEAFNIPFKTRDIQQHCTVSSLEKFILENTTTTTNLDNIDYPINDSQFGVYFDSVNNKGSLAYNIPALYKVDDNIDENTIKTALNKVCNAHPYIKTVLIANEKGEIRASRNDSKEVVINVIKQPNKPILKDIVKPFEMLNSNLYHFELYITDEGKYLYVDMHHIISDGTSELIFVYDLQRALANADIEKETYTAYEYAVDEFNSKNSDAYKTSKEYYNSLFASKENNFNIAKAKENDKHESKQINRLLKVNVKEINDYCDSHKISKNSFFNGAFSLVLSRFANNSEVSYATIHSGRNDSRLVNSIGMFVKTVPISIVLDESTDVRSYLETMQKQILKNMTNDIMSYQEIVNTYSFNSDIMFAYQGDIFTSDDSSSSLTINEYVEGYAKFPITVELIDNNGYNVNVSYLTDHYNVNLINSLIDSFEKVCDELIIRNQLKDISIVSDAANRFIESVNNTEISFIKQPIYKIFEQRVLDNPDKLCVKANNVSKTYSQINEMANRIANLLISKGVRKDDIIGIILDRSVDLIAAQIGINKAGGAFLSILESYPDDRIDYCLDNADCKFVITSSDIKDKRRSLFDNKNYSPITLDELYSCNEINNPNVDVDLNSLCYCIYTSGSTGTPKGVIIEHHSLSNFVQTSDVARKLYNYSDECDVGICMGSVSFDISILETYILLCKGKSLIIATEDEVHNPTLLANLINDNHVSIMACTPTFMSNMIDIDEFRNAMKSIKALMLGAEAFPEGLFERLKNINSEIRIMNAYGPTETTISCSSKVLNDGHSITIGGPSGNVKMFAIDKYGHIQPPYASGELIICGEGVSRGYIKLDKKNAETFFRIKGYPAYHSGDIVRMNNDGEFEYFGRNDNQVKLRGYRIELDEIEKAILSFTGIKQSKVIVKNNGSEDYLAAYFIADSTIDINELTSYLSSKLTYYMVPAAIKQLDVMPLNASGKIDKSKLPDIVVSKTNRQKRTAKKSTEQLLCDTFKNVLSLDEYYIDDNFFEMGGTSISASKVVMLLKSNNIDLEYSDIFDNPTPEKLANFIDSKNKSTDEDTIEDSHSVIKNEFPEVLKYNNLRYADEVTRSSLGDIFISGATGFLGIHVLAEAITSEKGHIYCLVRKGKFASPKERLLRMIAYYFDDVDERLVNSRVTVLDADITDDDIVYKMKNISFDTIINCAACVKHFAADDILERINVHGVENMIKLANEKNAKLIQISTTSIAGVHTAESYKQRVMLYEDQLFVINSMDNKYMLSKHHAEQKIFEAISKGLRAKVIRVGNLMGRYDDGEFQFNMNTNAFLNGVRGFATLGECPISHSTDPVSFSPIDLTAKVVIILAGTDDKFTAFNADSRYKFDEYQLIQACNRCDVPIKLVEDKQYYEDYQKALGDEKLNSRLTGLLTNDRPDLHPVETDNRFTSYILYRLGFAWPFVENDYLDKAIESIKTLGFFDMEE